MNRKWNPPNTGPQFTSLVVTIWMKDDFAATAAVGIVFDGDRRRCWFSPSSLLQIRRAERVSWSVLAMRKRRHLGLERRSGWDDERYIGPWKTILVTMGSPECQNASNVEIAQGKRERENYENRRVVTRRRRNRNGKGEEIDREGESDRNFAVVQVLKFVFADIIRAY